MESYKMKWWGWGEKDARFDLESYPGVVSFLRDKLGVEQVALHSDFAERKVKINPSLLPSEILQKFQEELGAEAVSTDDEDRLMHSFGKSYKDLIRIRTLEIKKAPDVVFFPKEESQIKRILELASEYSLALIPFGGGSSVVGGVEIERGEKKYAASVDMRQFSKILKIDTFSHIATVEAGIFGPQLEKELNQVGFTLGHFPQSFEFSTLGGWIASRSSGQNSVLYGGIEKNVVALKMIVPQGEIRTLVVPRTATGPSFKDVLIGSEGIFGIIISATIKITPLPEQKSYFMLALLDFMEAARLARTLAQEKIPIAMLRASDETESEAFWIMGKKKKTFFSPTALAEKYLRLKGLKVPGISLVLIGIEGKAGENRANQKKIQKILKPFRYATLGKSPGKKWLKERFFLPYLRDELLLNEIFVDTLETATTWQNLSRLYLGVKEALLHACEKEGFPGQIMVHISHLYPEGASLYFTIMTRQKKGKELEQWHAIKEAANVAIVENEGTISHHHGIGMDHINHVNWNPIERKLILDMKKTLDPDGVMNPGKLIKT